MARIVKIIYFVLCFICFSWALSNQSIENKVIKRVIYASLLVASANYAVDEIKNRK